MKLAGLFELGHRMTIIRHSSGQLTRIEGMPSVDEIALCHQSGGSLIVADFVFNLGRECSLATKALLKMSGVYRVTGALRCSVDEILEWSFERIVVCHGDVVDADGPESIRSAYGWL